MVYDRKNILDIKTVYQGGVSYDLKISSRVRLTRLSILPDGGVVVTVPQIFDEMRVARFVERHTSWIQKQVERIKKRTVLYGNKKEIFLYKQQAQAFAEERCVYFGKLYGVKPKKITIRAQKSRWGSCSRQGSLSFNYQIALLPPGLADQVIVHELCHLLEFNHSKKFWALVAQAIPDYLDRRRALRKMSIHMR